MLNGKNIYQDSPAGDRAREKEAKEIEIEKEKIRVAVREEEARQDLDRIAALIW